MTIPEIQKREGGISRQAAHSKIKKGEYVRVGPPKRNKHGKPSFNYEPAESEPPPSENTPKSRVFERRCVTSGRDPKDVLELLLFHCNSVAPSDWGPGPYGDTDLLATGIHLVMSGDRSFVDSLFGDSAPPCLETEVASLIRHTPRMKTNGEFPAFAKHPSFSDSWKTAKKYIAEALESGEWRYNRNPHILVSHPSIFVSLPPTFTINPKPRVLMRPRWHNKLSEESILRLYEIEQILSIDPDQVSIDNPEKDKHFDELLFTVHGLLHYCGEEVREITKAAITQLKWLRLDDGIWDERTTEELFETIAQKEARDWLKAQMPNDSARKCVETFAIAWARRYQSKISVRPTKELVNAIFQTKGYSEIDGWTPPAPSRIIGGGEPKFKGYDSQDDLDRGCYYERADRQGPRPAEKKSTQNSKVLPHWWSRGYDWGDDD